MSETLTNGIISPEDGNTDWGADLRSNWQKIDQHLGDGSAHITGEERQTLTTAAEQAKTTAAALTAHTENSEIHLTAEQAAKIAAAADDSAVVHLTGAETIAGTKTFSNNPIMHTDSAQTAGWFIDCGNLPHGSAPAETITQCWRVRDAKNTVAAEFAAQEYGTGNRRAYMRVADGEKDRRVHLLLTPGGVCTFGPANGADGITLGDGSHKWAQINGVAPAALGFPYFSKAADLKAEIGEAALTEAGASYVTAEVGWLVLYAPGATRVTAGTGWWMDEGIERLVMPLPGGGQTVTIKVTGGKVSVAKFVPCLGRTDAAAALLEPDFEKPTFRLPPEDEGGE